MEGSFPPAWHGPGDGVRLSPARFNRFLNKIGQGVLWRPAIDCPCRNPHSGGADPNCPVCLGIGQTWGGPRAGTVGVSGQTVQRQWAVTTQFELGDVVVTIPSDSPVYGVGEFDRVRFQHSSEPFSRVQVRGRETLFDRAIVRVDRVVVLRGGTLVDLPLPSFGEDGVPVWPESDPLRPGETYTLAGRSRPEYYCYGDFPQDRAHHHGLCLPRKVVLRKFDLFGRTR